MNRQVVTYIVGEERGILEILRQEDVRPLLAGAVRAGAAEALLVLDDGVPVCCEENGSVSADAEEKRVLKLEGEPVGTLVIRGPAGAGLAGIAGLVHQALKTVLNNNLKRMLTTETHTMVVADSHEELVKKNQELAESESRYRQLAETLEVQVQERAAEVELALARMLQQEKLASIGQLAAGVAHEINNPLGFVTSNLHTLGKYVDRLRGMLEWYRDRFPSDLPLGSEADAKWRELKIDAVLADVADLLSQSVSGAERVKKIILDLKLYSHVDEMESGAVDLVEELERTLGMLSHQLPPDATVRKDLQPLPPLPGNGAAFCQMFMNLMQNACQAMPAGLVLEVTTREEAENLVVTVADNGPGVPHPIRRRIFDPFFTTRDVGSGTGMGLAVVHETVKQHGGTIEVGESPAGGAQFTLCFPVERQDGIHVEIR